MRPFVSLLERARLPRVVAILLLLFVLIGGVVLLVINVTAQVNQFYSELPRYQARIRELVSRVTDFVNTLRERMGSILPEDAAAACARSRSRSRRYATTRGLLRPDRTTCSHFLLYAATVPFLTFFMLKDREKFGRVIDGHALAQPAVRRGT